MYDALPGSDHRRASLPAPISLAGTILLSSHETESVNTFKRVTSFSEGRVPTFSCLAVRRKLPNASDLVEVTSLAMKICGFNSAVFANLK
jgi:hypothetical protein